MAGTSAIIEPMARARGLVETAAAGAAAVVGVCTVLVATKLPEYSLVDDPGGSAALLLGVGWGVCLVGLVAWGRRTADRTGPLLVALGSTWLVAQWVSPGADDVFGPLAAPAFTAGLVFASAAPALVGHLALAYPGGRLRSPSRQGLAAAGYVTLLGLLGVGSTLFSDPLGQGCACPDNWLLVRDDPGVSSTLSRSGLGIGAGWAVVTSAFLVVAMTRASPAVRRIALPVVAPACACLLLSAASLAAGIRRGYLGTSELESGLRLAQAATLVGVAGGVGWGLLRSRRVQAALARSVVHQGGQPGRRVRDDLADLLDDPSLVIAHRLDDGRVVDSEARPVELALGPGRAVTEIPVLGSTVLLVHRAACLDSPVLRDAVASAAGLALTNDRLRARTLDQVAALQASQVRIVRAGDAERRRLERDLHDGAQQRLVGILLGLRLLRTAPEAPVGLLQQAEDELGQAIDDLRTLSHGLFPAVLADEGLAAALHALAETHRLTLGPLPDVRFPAEIETTAYLVVARAASTAAASVDASHDADRLTLQIRLQGLFDSGGLRDRVAALGGVLTVEQDDGQNARVTLVLPADLPPRGGDHPRAPSMDAGSENR